MTTNPTVPEQSAVEALAEAIRTAPYLTDTDKAQWPEAYAHRILAAIPEGWHLTPDDATHDAQGSVAREGEPLQATDYACGDRSRAAVAVQIDHTLTRLLRPDADREQLWPLIYEYGDASVEAEATASQGSVGALREAAQRVVDAVNERHDNNKGPWRYGTPYGEVTALMKVLTDTASLAEAHDKAVAE